MQRSCKGSLAIAHLENKISEIDRNPDSSSRNGRFNRAVTKAVLLTESDWVNLSMGLKTFKQGLSADIKIPTALQITIDPRLERDLLGMEESIKTALELKKLQTRYEIEIIYFYYLQELKHDAMQAGTRKNPQDLTGPEMTARLVEILMLNRKEDQKLLDQIKNLLQSWEV